MTASPIVRLALSGALSTVVAGCIMSSGAAYADGAAVDHESFHGTQTFEDPNPCTGTMVSGTEVVTMTLHETDLAGGQVLFHFTEQGSAAATDETSGVTYSGHFAVAGGEQMNARSDTSTISQVNRIAGSDGSLITVHEVMHLTTDANGAVTVSFDDVRISGCS